MIPTLKSIFNFNQWKQVQQWVNNKLTLKQDIFNANNTATGTTSVTINAKSGVATFTATVEIFQDQPFSVFTINNNLVTSSTKLFHSLSYDPAGDESCQISFYACSSNTISFYLTNFSSQSTNNPFQISFQILN